MKKHSPSTFFELDAKKWMLSSRETSGVLQPPVCHLRLEFPAGQGIKTVSIT